MWHSWTKSVYRTSDLWFIIALVLFNGCVCWPEGRYGLPMPQTGCPDSSKYQWLTGYRIQHTEAGSKGSPHNHFASVPKEENNRIQQDFCMKNTQDAVSDHMWGRGRYCIFKGSGSSCPKDFREGQVYWDDAAPLFTSQTHQDDNGYMPDGDYDKNTLIKYCCRDDGRTSLEMKLPTSDPFYLLRRGGDCQQVKSMSAQVEWIYWSDETTINLNHAKGSYPDIKRTTIRNKRYTKMYYCYYTLAPPNKQAQRFLLAIYVILGIGAFVFAIMCGICVVRYALALCPQRKRHTVHQDHGDAHMQNTTNSCIEHRLTVNPHTGCIAYNVAPNTPTSDPPSPLTTGVVYADSGGAMGPPVVPYGAPPAYEESSAPPPAPRVKQKLLSKKMLMGDDRDEGESDAMIRPCREENTMSPWTPGEGDIGEPPPYEDHPSLGPGAGSNSDSD